MPHKRRAVENAPEEPQPKRLTRSTSAANLSERDGVAKRMKPKGKVSPAKNTVPTAASPLLRVAAKGNVLRDNIDKRANKQSAATKLVRLSSPTSTTSSASRRQIMDCIQVPSSETPAKAQASVTKRMTRSVSTRKADDSLIETPTRRRNNHQLQEQVPNSEEDEVGSESPSKGRGKKVVPKANDTDKVDPIATPPNRGEVAPRGAKSLVKKPSGKKRPPGIRPTEGSHVAPARTTPEPVPTPAPRNDMDTKDADCTQTPLPEPPICRAISPDTPSSTQPVTIPRLLPPDQYTLLGLQRDAILRQLQCPPLSASQDPGGSFETLTELLNGTCERGEGNSCLVLGPRSSGKTRLIERSLESLSSKPIVIRLSGLAQSSDRLAMREIANQLNYQTDLRLAIPDEDGEPEELLEGALAPPPAHLPTLIAMLPTLSRPCVVILDAFDSFASHARQALLYCLLDSVQSCRPGGGRHGLAVVGVSTRIDCLNLLEKRVKSRFSHRIVRVANPRTFDDYISVARTILNTALDNNKVSGCKEWGPLWRAVIDRFLNDAGVIETLKETYGLQRDIRTLCRLLTPAVLALSPSRPWPNLKLLDDSIECQLPSRFPFLSSLPYSAQALLVAAQLYHSSQQDTFTFAMLHSTFQKKLSLSDNLQSVVAQSSGGGSVKMMGVPKDVLLTAFEHLVLVKVFLPVAASSVSAAMPKEFMKYRSAADREEVKTAIDKTGNTNLKSWLAKAGEL